MNLGDGPFNLHLIKFIEKLLCIVFYRYYACLCGHEALVKYLLENGNVLSVGFMSLLL